VLARFAPIFLFAAIASSIARGAERPALSGKVLFGQSNGFHVTELKTRDVEARLDDGALRLEAAKSAEDRGVVFPLGATDSDLSGWSKVEIELSNPSPAPVVITFWALSGHGWGGSSTFTTTHSSRESLAPGASGVFRINLHAR
jgi:hypothetical protein